MTTVTEAPRTMPDADHAPDTAARAIWALARLVLGFVALWAFLDKLFGLGKATPAENAWVNGGHPTAGYLSGVTSSESANPVKGLFEFFTGQPWADWLFMLGLAGIGVAMILGICLRIAAFSAALLFGLIWLSSLPLENNPVIDQHLVYVILAIGLAASKAGDTLGLGRWWAGRSVVRWLPVLR